MSNTDKPVNVVPMPSFTDPNRPEAAGGSINRQLHEAVKVVPHDDNYGAGRMARNVSDDPAFAPVAGADAPEDRAEWTKAQWKAQCEAYGLPVSGNLDELQARVEEYEYEQGAKTDDSEEG